eukprot:scaffold32234_cov43-Prasinocladus_malaysianus.AAC.1
MLTSLTALPTGQHTPLPSSWVAQHCPRMSTALKSPPHTPAHSTVPANEWLGVIQHSRAGLWTKKSGYYFTSEPKPQTSKNIYLNSA